MSVGLGIFLSTILALVVWQVDKRGAWGKLRWVVYAVLAVAILFWVGILAINVWDQRQRSHIEAPE